jgi:hypothetical protein
MPIRAVITALGPSYLREALLAAESLVANGGIKDVRIYTDQAIEHSSVGGILILPLVSCKEEQVLVDEWRKRGSLYNCKAFALQQELSAPAEERPEFILQIDSDIYCIADISHLELEVASFDIAVAYECENQLVSVKENQWVSTGMLRIESDYSINSGVVIFNIQRAEGLKVLSEWLESLLDPSASSVPEIHAWNDQASLNWLLKNNNKIKNKRLLNVEYNCIDRLWYETYQLGRWKNVKILHSSIINQHYADDSLRLCAYDWSLIEQNPEVYAYVSRYQLFGGYISPEILTKCREIINNDLTLHSSESISKILSSLNLKKVGSVISGNHLRNDSSTAVLGKNCEPVIMIYGNSQTTQLAKIIAYKAGTRVIHIPPCHLATQEDVNSIRRSLPLVNYLFSQEVHNGYRNLEGAGSSELLNIVDIGYIIPNLVCFRDQPFMIDSSRLIEGFDFSYFDILLYASARNGFTVYTLLSILERSDFKAIMFNVINESLIEMIRRSQRWNLLDISNILYNIFSTHQQAFYAINHPAPFLLELVADCICHTIGINTASLDKELLMNACFSDTCENYIFYWLHRISSMSGTQINSSSPYLVDERSGRKVDLESALDVYTAFVQDADLNKLCDLDSRLKAICGTRYTSMVELFKTIAVRSA